METRALRAVLLGSASVAVLGLATPTMAQDLADSDTSGTDFLGEIELGASKRDVRTDTAVPVTNINQEEINDRQAGTIAQLIDTVPGVTLVNGSTPQSSGISIRGFGANGTYGSNPRVLINIDGATTGGEEIYRIGNQLFTDPALYKNVSVLRGTIGSFEYGSGVVGGVVKLETKDASDFTGGEIGLRLHQTLGAQSNGGGFNSSTIAAWQPSEDTEFLMHYSYQDYGTYDSGNGNTIDATDFSNYSFMLKGKHTFGVNKEHSITAWYNKTKSDDQDVPYDVLGASTGGGFYFGNVDRAVDSETAGLRYDWNPNGNDLINLQATLTYSKAFIDSTYVPGSCRGFPGCDASVSDLLNADHDDEITKLTIKNTSYFQTGSLSHDLRVGVEVSTQKRVDVNSGPGGTDRRYAFFAVDDIAFNDNFSVTAALRYENQEVEGTDIVSPGSSNPYNGTFSNDALMGGIAARYEFDSGFALFASASYTEVMPRIDRLDKPSATWIPEKGTTYEAGVSYQKSGLFGSNDRLAVKANYYTTNLRDVRVSSGPLRNQFGQVDVDGIELEASYGHDNGFYVDLNATYGSGDQLYPDGSSQDWIFAPARAASLTVGKRFGDALDLSWELVASEGVEAINSSAASPNHLGGYGVNNLRATYRVQQGALEGAEIRFGVENVFDKQYQTQLSTRPSAGRNFKLSLAKTF